jgi:ribA/ribD-fused uncharacterized protein
MESLITPQVLDSLSEFLDIAKRDPKAEVECKLLPGKIQVKDVADRIVTAIETLCVGSPTEENRMTLSYPDSSRVSIVGAQHIQKLCVSNSFKGIPLNVERKQKYFEGNAGKRDILDVPDANARFTLRSEIPIRKDWEGNPSDSRAHVRLLNRKSYKTQTGLFQIDFSMVKSRPTNSRKTVRDLLKEPTFYELEIEFVNRDTSLDGKHIVAELLKVCTTILQAYYRSGFLLSNSDIQRYQQEFYQSGHKFFNPVTLLRSHLVPSEKYSILKGYTVTNKADGERSGLYVARDRRVLKVSPTKQVTWTGITATSDKYAADFVDGEYIPDKNLFCIFDVYRFRNRDVKLLPLLISDDDILKNPLASRLGCAREFVKDIRSEFTFQPSLNPMRIETKLFLAGDGPAMEEAIQSILSTNFEYKTDGLIFTPRSTGVAPPDARVKNTWVRVYKWKPADQNSIDFLLQLSSEETFDPIAKSRARKGELYVSRSQGDSFIFPRETMTGEYVEKPLPDTLKSVAKSNDRIPAIFQPDLPRDPDAYQILIPVNEKGILVDREGIKIEDNTIVECSFDIDTRRWEVMRTRYEKTYQYRVLREPQYGNDIKTANSIWTSIHVPVTDEMIRTFHSNPPEQIEDDMYYRDDIKRSSRIFSDVYDFHLSIKENLYKQNIRPEDTLLELACGRGGDIHRWKRVHVSKVVGLDISLADIVSPTQGAAVRYLKDRMDKPHDYMPKILFLQGDMSVYPLFEQSDKYMAILRGDQKAPTEYLETFEGLQQYDTISCQFALHYACESEEKFRDFAKNLQKYGNGLFFGTCSDGQSIYQLLMGKKTHLFGSEKQVAGEYTKEYLDKDTWTEEFGMPVKVMLESFVKPQIEYLVPFEKVRLILEEHDYELVDSKLFSEIYSQQIGKTLTQVQQTFSFLNRTFVFRKLAKKAPIEEPPVESVEEGLPEETIQKVEIPVSTETKPKRKLRKGGGEPEPEPILFFGSDESKGPYRNLSNMSEHPIDVDGEKFPTVEHYFQAMKAKTFKDDEIYNKIVKSKTPKAAKALGSKVKNFVKEVWDDTRDEIMSRAIHAKFTQHPELQNELLDTGDKVIGEANPRDTYWGIGTSMESEKSKQPSKWRGRNRLGQLLMELRTRYKQELLA